MPIPHLNKRSYGYVGNKNPKKKRPKKLRLRKKKRKNIYLSSWFWRTIKKQNKKHNLKKKLVLGIIAAVVLGFIFLTILFAWASKDLPDPDKLTDRHVAQSTKIYDRTGEHLLYEIFADERRTIVELEDLPQALIDGVIATEDTKFYEHKGIRPLSILRAAVMGIFTNKRIAGTSTLTQQLVKNAILTDERSILRKVKEAILSIRLEQKYTKDQILKIYFNEIPYGSTNYGVESAAQSYFGKHISDLSLAESATLAGLPKAPSKYLNNQEALQQRRDFVLYRMSEEGFITLEEKESAQAQPLEIRQQYHDINAPHFVLYVKELLVEKYGEAAIETGGLKVITTIDWDKQEIAERVISEEGEDTLIAANADNASLVAMDPRTGQVLAMVGSRDFFDNEIDGQFNVATLGKRQPGSSFKPIVYAAAFEKGYTLDTVLFDTLTNFAVSGKPYMPRNYDLQEHGPLSMRKALQGSLNIPAVKTLYLVGAKKGVEFAERLGYSTLSEGVFGLTLVLGGGEVKLLEHVNAFSAFANAGVQYDPISILKVEDSTGKVLEEWKKKKGKQVIGADIAATMSNVLSDDNARAYAFGAGGILTLPGRPVAAKTGTTNNYIDAWTVGYTPSLVAGVWAGNTDNSPMNRGFGGSRVAAPLWNKFMRQALENSPVEGFPSAPKNTAQKAVLNGGTNGQITLKVDKVTGKLATSTTPVHYIEERTYLPPHSLLHYVQKDDPRGDPPKDPTDDYQYIGWEAGIQEWIKRRMEEDPEWKISFEDPPTEYDDIHSLEMIPTVEIVYPAEGEILVTRKIQTDIRASAPRGVKKAIYQLDGVYIDVVEEHPFNLDYTDDNLEPGEHTLVVMVEDDVGNRIEEEILFLLDIDPSPAQVSFAYDYSTLNKNQFPKTMVLNYHKLNEIEEVRLYYNDELAFATSDFSQIFEGELSIVWKNAPEPGEYELKIEITKQGGEVVETDSRQLTIDS